LRGSKLSPFEERPASHYLSCVPHPS
jgi:hypothetical protein